MGPDIELDGDAFMAKPSPTWCRWQFVVLGLTELVFAAACILVLARLLLPWPTYCDWPRAREAQCRNNLKQIARALDSYRQEYGVLPPAYVADANGRPTHSWRVLILPFLDQSALRDKYDFTEPWDGPNNIKLLDSMPSCFICPARLPYSKRLTSYAAITGPGTMFSGAGSVKFADVTDGLSDTLMIVETSNVNIPWTAPIDLDIRTMSLKMNDPDRPSISSRHAVGANIGFGDAQVYSVTRSIPEETLRALITIAGGEGVKADEALHPR